MTLKTDALAEYRTDAIAAELAVLPAGAAVKIKAALDASFLSTLSPPIVVGANDLVDARPYGGTLYLAVVKVDDVVLAAVFDSSDDSVAIHLARYIGDVWEIYEDGGPITTVAGLGAAIAERDKIDVLAADRRLGRQR